MNHMFHLRIIGWAVALSTVHTSLRVVSGTATPVSFLGDLTFFAAAMLAIAALPAGIAASRDLSLGLPGSLKSLAAISGIALGMAILSYGIADQIAPRVRSVSDATATGVEPASLTSTQLRAAARDGAAEAKGMDAQGIPSVAAWQEVNRLAFAHELRIVQALLLPIMGLIGVLAGARARRLVRPWSTAALWGLALFLVLSMFMAGENGYELIVLRSSGPMAFVAWLQLVVPGSVLAGLAFAALPDLLEGSPDTVQSE